MIKEELKFGHFVQYNGGLYTIKKIDFDIFTLNNGLKLKSQEVKPIEIGDPLDSSITLFNDHIRYPIVTITPIEKFRYYLDCYISKNTTIRDLVRENTQIKYLHELQDWLSLNAQTFKLKCFY